MKVDLTRKAYESGFKDDPLFREFDEIVRAMGVGEKTILEGSDEMDVAGEVLIYGLLTRNQVDARTAAEAAVAFPNPIHFNGFINPNNNSTYVLACELAIQYGVNPLDALLQVVEQCDGRGIDRRQYMARCKEFREFVEAKV